MVLVAAIAVVSLVAILAVATLSLSGRLLRGSTLAARASALDAATSYGLGSVGGEWRPRSLGRLAVGTTVEFAAQPPGSGPAISVSVTRVSTDLFWIVAEASAADGSVRRENVVYRVPSVNADSLIADDSGNVATLGSLEIDSIARSADVVLASGSVWTATDGVVHARGDLTVVGGAAAGVLIVDGKLTITAPVAYSGVIVVRNGMDVGSPGVVIEGLLRLAGPASSTGGLVATSSATAVQDVLGKELMPSVVAGRRWSELH